MYREILEDLRRWKDRVDRKPILLKGARQVGKTWVMRQFGRECFDHYAFFDFDKTRELNSVFQMTKDPVRILKELTLYTESPLIPGKTLIIFDEIQLCEEALNALKYFKEEAPEYHVIAAGSLLGVAVRKRHMTVPVGKVNIFRMYPVTFKEFLRSSDPETFGYVENYSEISPLPEIIFNKLKSEFRRYQVCGGMPEAVAALLDNRGMGAVDTVLKEILDLYELDFSQYATPLEVTRIKALWHSLPAQLSKENRKFIYKVIKTGARAKDYEDALEWLKESGLIYKVFDISTPGMPLSAYMDRNAFKVYAVDCGLLRRLAGLPASVVLDPISSYTEFKGAFTENVALQSMLPWLEEGTYTYWTSEGKAEVDFVLQLDDDIIPVEVKSEDNVSGKSLSVYAGKFDPDLMVRLSMQNLSLKDKMLKCPLPLVCWLDSLLKSVK